MQLRGGFPISCFKWKNPGEGFKFFKKKPGEGFIQGRVFPTATTVHAINKDTPYT